MIDGNPSLDFSRKIVNAAAKPIELADKYGNMDVTGGTSPSAQADAIIGSIGDKPDPLIYGGLKGFFSRVGKWVESLPQEKFSAEQLLGQMKAAPIKKEEVDWLGLSDWLKDKASQGMKVAKSEVMDFINQHQIQMKEVQLSNKHKPVTPQDLFEASNRTPEENARVLDESGLRAQYSDPGYKTPGGRNYREVLFKYDAAPSSPRPDIESDLHYSSNHFGDQGQDLLAHARVQDFKDVEGKKVMLVDELQSDWHREGRKYGYNSIASGDFKSWMNNVHPTETQPTLPYQSDHPRYYEWSRLSQKSVPDAPFKSTWHELVMKSMLRDAVEKGYDKLAWTTGKTQQDRWNLTRFFPELGWRIQPADYQFFKQRSSDPFSAPDFKVKITGAVWHGDQSVPISQLEDYVGQAAADHIRTQIKQGVEDGSLKDVKSGGEWAENLYDKQVPSFMNKYAAKWGGKVETTQLKHPPLKGETISQALERAPNEVPYTTNPLPANTVVHSLTITPAMRDSIKTTGQPLWSAIPFVGAAIAKSVHDQQKVRNYHDAQVPSR